MNPQNSVPEDKAEASAVLVSARLPCVGGATEAGTNLTVAAVARALAPGSNNEKILATLTGRKLLSSVGRRSSVRGQKATCPDKMFN